MQFEISAAVIAMKSLRRHWTDIGQDASGAISTLNFFR